MYYCITIYMLEKWPISLSYHHIIFGLGGHVFCLLAEKHCTRWRGKKKSKKTTISNFKLYNHMSVKELGTITVHITKHTSYTARNKQEKFEGSFRIQCHAESMKKNVGAK